MSRRGRIGLFGLGAWGKNHLRVLTELEDLRSVFDPDAAASGRAPFELRAPSVDAVLGDPGVEAVVIATPATTHEDLARRALSAGKDVFVEKPLTLDPDGGRELVELADRLGRVLMVGHVMVYHPAILALREILQRGELGQPRYIYSNRLNLGTVRETENILWSFAPHDFAVLLYLLGQSPTKIQAIGSSYLKPGRADVTVTHLDFARGVRAHIFVSWLNPTREHRLVVTGDRRMAVFVDDGKDGRLEIFDVGVDLVGDRAVHRRNAGEPVRLPAQEPLRLQMAHFLECIDRREEPLTGGRHGLEVVRLLSAADESLQQGGVPVAFAPGVGYRG